MDSVHKYNRVDCLQRTLLPFSCNGKNLICDTAYCRVGDLYAVDIADMFLDIRGCHALGIHGQDLFLNILADAGLVLFQKLWVEFSLSVSGYRHLYIAEAGTQRFAAVTVTAVVRVLILVVILRVAKLIVQFGVQTVLHKFSDGFLEEILDIFHAADSAAL